MNIKCKIRYQAYPNKDDKLNETDYRIFKAEPMQTYEGLVLDNNFQFSLKGDLAYLFVGDEYELDIELIEKNKWGGTYKVNQCLSLGDFENLTRKQSEQILNKVASKTNTKTLLDAYPDFIKLVLTTDWHETIDVAKLYNIKEAKMNSYTRQLNERYKYYSILNKYSCYDLSISDCRKLIVEFKDNYGIDKAFDNNPYQVLIDILGRRFTRDKSQFDKTPTVDEMVCEVRPDLIDSDIRTEYLMLEVLTRNEQGDGTDYFVGGSTRLGVRKLWDYCKEYAQQLAKRMSPVACDCNGIHYDQEKKIMSKMSTYMKEIKIRDFIRDLYENKSTLDLEWEKYKEIKDGTLTDEQTQVLKAICENRFVIVDALAGGGKSSSMMAVLQMFDDYNISYRCMTATGKSAKRLAESSGRVCHTIHRDTMNGVVNEQVIVLDEDSLLSIELLCMVIDAVTNPNVRFLCLGDIQQLLNLSLGTPIKDLIESGIVKVCTLSKCFRFGLGGKATVSTKCRRGEFYIEDKDLDKDIATYGQDKDYTFIKFNGTQEQIVDTYVNTMKKYNCKADDVWVITPWNVKDYGSYALNNMIQAIVNPPKPNEINMKIKRGNVEIVFRVGDIVMNNVNNYNCISEESYNEMLADESLSKEDMPKEECMNGMNGKVVSVQKNVMKILFDEQILVFSKEEVKNLTLGYAINHFKAQGSQISHVILLTLNCHKRSLNKQLLYTGLTRATQTVQEIGELSAIEYSVDKNDTNSRDTWLPDLLQAISSHDNQSDNKSINE